MKSINLIFIVASLMYVNVNSQTQTCSTDTGCPTGAYISQGCNDCYMNPDSPGGATLTCNCNTGSGNVITSTIDNSFACNGCIQNVFGQLTCVYPYTALNNGYAQNCYGCAMSGTSLQCEGCVGNNIMYSLQNACGCVTGVSVSGSVGLLQCDSNPTPAPTFPTLSPTNPTLTPTNPTPSPQNAANLCPIVQGNYWAQFTTETAPQKRCDQFTARQGCEMQNFCCWQPTPGGSANQGVCVNPEGVPECVGVAQSTCQGQQPYATYCQWSSTPGYCHRICPGNAVQLCAPYN